MKSKCCNAPVNVAGNTTKYYICTECTDACDIMTSNLHDDLAEVLTKHGMTQNISPKRLAEYLLRCIEALDVAVMGGGK